MKLPEVDWCDIKESSSRVPQILKNKVNANFLDYSDSDFDQLLVEYNIYEREFVGLQKHCKKYAAFVMKGFETSKGIGKAMEAITNSSPQNYKEFHLFDKATSYSFTISVLEPEVKRDLDQMVTRVDEKVNALLKYFKCVEKTIKQRNILLLDYQKANEDYIRLKARDKELSLTEYKQLYTLESKSETNKKKYDLVNNTLKREIPLFLVVCKGISCRLFTLIYFTTVFVLYRISVSLNSFTDKFNISSVDGDVLLKEFHEKQDTYSNEVSKLNIVKFSEVSFTKLNAKISGDLNNGEYIALYDFAPVQEGDISLKINDRIMVVSFSDGWWIGTNERTGLTGAFPFNYVTKNVSDHL